MNILGVQGKKYDLGQKLTGKIILFEFPARVARNSSFC